MGAESAHPGRRCKSCAVCGVVADAFRHPANWNEELKQWLMKSGEIDCSSCVCHKCEQNIRRRWTRSCEKENKKSESDDGLPDTKRVKRNEGICLAQELYRSRESTSICCSSGVISASFPGCTIESVGACFAAVPEIVAHALTIVLPEGVSVDSNVFPFCKLHHNQLYRLVLLKVLFMASNEPPAFVVV